MKPCWKPCYIAFVHSTSDVVGLLVCWDGFWCILPPHLLQQLGPNLHRIDEVKLADCRIIPRHKVTWTSIIVFETCHMHHSLFVVLKSPILVSFRHCVGSLFIYLKMGCELDRTKPDLTPQTSPKSSSKQCRWVLRWRCRLLLLLLHQTDTSNSWPSMNTSGSNSWWQRRRKGANGKRIVAAIRIYIRTMAAAVGKG